jgi:putative membrane protein
MSTALNAILMAPGWYTWGGGWGWGWTWFWLPFSVLLWLAVGAVVIWFAATRGGWQGAWAGGWGHDRAREILAERYARGELTHEEYLERLGHLR